MTHPQRNLIQIAEAIGDEFYYDSRRPSERGNPEKRKSAELDDMQKSMLMPKANEPGPIQPGNEPITVGHLRQAAKGLPTDHPLMQSLGKKLGRLGDHVTAIKGADPFYLIHDDIKKAVNVYRLSITPQREPVRKELNNSVEYNTKNIIEVAEQIFLNETLDTILPHKVIRDEPMESNPDVHQIHHEIRVPDGSKIVVKNRIMPGFPTYEQLGSDEKPKNELHVKFEGPDGNMALTGKHKHSLAILGTVNHITNRVADDPRHNIGKVSWTPVSSKGGDEGKKEKSRRNRVYGRLAKRAGRTVEPSGEDINLTEIALTQPPEPDYSYDHEYHISQYEKAISAPHIQALKNTNERAYQQKLDDALRVHNPMKWHAEEAAESLASAHHGTMRETGESIPKAQADEILKDHAAGFISSIQRYHPDKYGYSNTGSPMDHMIKHHSYDFLSMVKGNLVKTHKLKDAENGLEDI